MTLPASAQWRDIFPFDPYPTQEDAITEAIDVVSENGFYAFEGPCGTGKTLIALSAGLDLVADPSTVFERLFVVTSKKQQIAAFEDDIAEINAASDDMVNSLTLVGKSDLCPYVATDTIDKGDIYDRCDELKDGLDNRTSDLSKRGLYKNKARAANVLAEDAVGSDPIVVDSEATPYQEPIPEDEGTEYCPFFARFEVDDKVDRVPVTAKGVTDAKRMRRKGSEAGTCPHAAMKRLAPDVDVLIGNYNHIFSPRTVQGFTGQFIEEQTLLIIDEAHELVSNVRDELSYSLDMQTFHRAINDLDDIISWFNGNGRHAEYNIVHAMEERGSFDREDIAKLKDILTRINHLFTTQIKEHLSDEHGSQWQQTLSAQSDQPDQLSVELQNKSERGTDVLRRWVEANADPEIWSDILYTCYAASRIKDTIVRKIYDQTPASRHPIGEVREFLHRWLVGDHTAYHREVNLDPLKHPDSDVSDSRPWRVAYNAELNVNNCIPKRELAATFDAFGGAIIQSATLAPIDVYSEETGLDLLETGNQPDDSLVTKAADRYGGSSSDDDESDAKSENEDITKYGGSSEDGDEKDSNKPNPEIENASREVQQREFETTFPEENRASKVVDLTEFTWSNRTSESEHPQLRPDYAAAIKTVARTTPGNVITFMPSYEEARWAKEVLEDASSVNKPVLSDGSSTNEETEILKDEFFSGEPKILTTSLRGTLVEGVDFDGDKLRGAVVCGVPISYTGSALADAIKDAYRLRFDGSNGFDYAYCVPASRKTRQAIGRVIRGTEDVGVRVLVDERYSHTESYTSVRQHFPDSVLDEFDIINTPSMLEDELQRFWRG